VVVVERTADRRTDVEEAVVGDRNGHRAPKRSVIVLRAVLQVLEDDRFGSTERVAHLALGNADALSLAEQVTDRIGGRGEDQVIGVALVEANRDDIEAEHPFGGVDDDLCDVLAQLTGEQGSRRLEQLGHDIRAVVPHGDGLPAAVSLGERARAPARLGSNRSPPGERRCYRPRG